MAGPFVSPDRDQRDDLFFWLALRMAPGVGPTRFQRLVERFGSPRAVFRASADALRSVDGLPEKTVSALRRLDWDRRVSAELDRAGDLGVDLVTIDHPSYPPRLRRIYNPPPILYVKGSLCPEDEAAAAMVGTRRPTEYGRATARRMGSELAGLGVTVVSGGAIGIDAEAHQGALDGGGRTIAVLGCGVDVRYPRTHHRLFEQTARSGAVISEFPLGTAPQPGHFPLRNRVIAGLSLAVVVVEAAEKSGALITARLALEQNRDVLAVPGQAGGPQSRGANALLKNGARLVETGRDVYDEIEPQLERRPRIAEPAARQQPPEASPPGLSEEELAIWDAMGDEATHVDPLCRLLGWPMPRLAAALLNMELKGVIRQLPGTRYIRDL
jgi:DNA processing protein